MLDSEPWVSRAAPIRTASDDADPDGTTRGWDGFAPLYDEQGNLIWMTDPIGRTTTYEYDAAGRNTRVEQPEGDAEP